MDETQKRLYDDLEGMRENSPVTWSVLVGKRTVPKIAEHLIMAPKKVEREVNQMIEEGIVRQGQYMGRPVLQIVDEDFKKLADFAWRFRQKVLGRETKPKSPKK